MACPRCGTDCHCSPLAPVGEAHTTVFIDPDHYDPSEEQFAASFDVPPGGTSSAASPSDRTYGRTSSTANVAVASALQADDFYRPQSAPALVDDAWRSEVASRLNNFRARRRRPAHVKQSMSLQFEAPAATVAPAELAPDHGGYVAVDYVPEEGDVSFEMSAEVSQAWGALPVVAPAPPPLRRKKLIEFPRSVEPVEEPTLFDDLAEPVIQTPRIFEAEPEPVVAPDTSFAGMTFAPQESSEVAAEPEVHADEVAVPAASLLLRMAADVVDALFAAAGTLVFLAAARELAHPVMEGRALLAAASASFAFFSAAYQVILWTWAGTTVGTAFCGMELRTFDGVPPTRKRRLARACSSTLSSGAAGLGFLWALIDEDALCWHDRISRTCTVQRERD
jgi:uncharacterized RDD family membrane protein YckC